RARTRTRTRRFLPVRPTRGVLSRRRCCRRHEHKVRPHKLTNISRRVQMKIPNTARLLTLAAASLLVATACSSTRTQKSAGETIDDGVISTEVNGALVGDSQTKAHNIDVE